MTTIPIASIKKELLVAASQETAFTVFTEKMHLWWPLTHHIGKSPMIEPVLEPGVGGRWFSKHEDGSEVNIGHVLAWDPFGHLVLAWQINGKFQYDSDLITEVEIRFIPEGENVTRIKMEHKNLDRLGDGDKTSMSMDEGWGMILQLYKTATEKQ